MQFIVIFNMQKLMINDKITVTLQTILSLKVKKIHVFSF